ncbi:hypothetical protein OSTOST_07328, partial [Ostertagia ostertagi]
GSWRNESGGQSIITRHGFLKGEGLFPSVNVNRKNELMCTSYCPANSECIDGICRCTKGFGGNPLFGCEDIDECMTDDPCPKAKYTWCVNTIGSYHCCTPESLSTDCIGLEIAAGPGGGMKLIGLGKEGETFLAASMNESTTGETISQSIHEVRNFSGGEILVVKNKVKSDIFDTKAKEGEVGLEISGDSAAKKATLETFPLPASISFESTTAEPVITVTLPGVISTLGGASTFTTSIPITEIPVHGSSPPTPVRSKNGSLEVEIDGSGADVIEDGARRKGTSTTLSMTEESGSGEEPTEAGTETATAVIKQNRESAKSAETEQTTAKTEEKELTGHEDEDLIGTTATSTESVTRIAISGEEVNQEEQDKKIGKGGTKSGTSSTPTSGATSSPAASDKGATSAPGATIVTTSGTGSASASGVTIVPASASTHGPDSEAKSKSDSGSSGTKLFSPSATTLSPSESTPAGVSVDVATNEKDKSPMTPTKDEQGLEISFRPTGGHSAAKTPSPPKIGVDLEGSGEEPSDS